MNADEFWGNVDQSGKCWEWQRSVDSRGYGHLYFNGKTSRAHRVAYELARGKIPSGDGHCGTVVMHSCDNKLCCNPEHLSLGTQNENMRDMARKGRRKNKCVGSFNGRAKLTIEQVQEIRKSPLGKVRLSRIYGVSPAQIQRIRAGKQWNV